MRQSFLGASKNQRFEIDPNIFKSSFQRLPKGAPILWKRTLAQLEDEAAGAKGVPKKKSPKPVLKSEAAECSPPQTFGEQLTTATIVGYEAESQRCGVEGARGHGLWIWVLGLVCEVQS